MACKLFVWCRLLVLVAVKTSLMMMMMMRQSAVDMTESRTHAMLTTFGSHYDSDWCRAGVWYFTSVCNILRHVLLFNVSGYNTS